jgi:filamentous hemagglutinin family protein
MRPNPFLRSPRGPQAQEPEAGSLRRSTALLAALLALPLAGAGGAHANQGLVVRDQTMGVGQGLAVGSGLDSAGVHADYLITPEMGVARGENLFHSFSEFGVGGGEIATFTGTAGAISRFLVRVTGSQISLVDGAIRSSVNGADMVFLNPNGVIFSPSGSIDIQGSFAVTTAGRLEFSDGVFPVTDAGSPWGAGDCCTGPPTAYLFAGADPASAGAPAEIRIDTELFGAGTPFSVPVGEEVSAVGGTITVGTGQVGLTNGAILFAATGHAAVRVPIDLALDGGWLAPLGSEAAIRLGRGSYLHTSSLQDSPSGQGRVVLRGGSLELDLTSISAGGPDGGGVDIAFSGDVVLNGGPVGPRIIGSRIVDRSSGPLADGIQVKAGSLSLDNATRLEATAGGIRLEVESLSLDNSAQIVATAGDIVVRSPGVVRVANGSSIRTATALADSEPAVDAGNVRLIVGSLDLLSGGQIASQTGGQPWKGPDPHAAGNIEIEVATALRIDGSRNDGQTIQRSGILSRAESGATGEARGGNIQVVTGSLEMTQSALISARSFTDAPAGNIEIRAASSVRLTGGLQPVGEEVTEISNRGIGGGAGFLRIEAPLIEVLDGAAISATSEGAGSAGDVTIVANRLRISGQSTPEQGIAQASAIFSEAASNSQDPNAGGTLPVPDGSAGMLLLTLRDGLEISEGGVLSVRTRGSGSAGDIVVNVEGGSIEISSGGTLSSESDATHARAGAAGSLILFAAEDIRVSGGGELRATAEAVDAGDIRLEAGGELVLIDSLINTRSGSALGGNIYLDAGSLVHLIRSGAETDVGGAGDGGNILLGQGSARVPTPPRFAVLNASRLTATAEEGQGGFIFIAAGQYLESPDSRVDASSGDPTKDGIVELVAPELELSGNLEVLPSSYLDVSVVLQEHCAARRDREGTSLTLEERPNIGPEPGGYLAASVLPAPVLPAHVLPGSALSAAASPAPEASQRTRRSAPLPLPLQLATFDPTCGR